MAEIHRHPSAPSISFERELLNPSIDIETAISIAKAQLFNRQERIAAGVCIEHGWRACPVCCRLCSWPVENETCTNPLCRFPVYGEGA